MKKQDKQVAEVKNVRVIYRRQTLKESVAKGTQARSLGSYPLTHSAFQDALKQSSRKVSEPESEKK